METIEQEFINKLAQSIASLATNHIPLDQRLWSAEDCAQYLRMEKRTFVQYYAPHPKFPKPIPLDRAEGKGKMRWKAQSVIDWALKNEGKIS
jgi:hypothetical protein